jgi:tyramine---L-glutamate ligase
MGLFVHEYFSSGAFPGELRHSSLAPEGLAMLAALLEDFAGCSIGRIATSLDRRLAADAHEMSLAAWADIHWAESAEHESVLFSKLAAEAEATFVIAPESDGILLARRRQVDDAGGRFLGHSADAIQLCSDKLAFCEHLARHELPTVPTELFDSLATGSTFQFPVVVKPRDGAGSQDTFLVCDERDLRRHREILRTTFGPMREGNVREALVREAIMQPYVAGRSLSAAAIVDSVSGFVQVFPTGQQHQSDDGRFRYRGGAIPARLPASVDVAGLVKRICQSINGLSGYVGFDLILPSDSPQALFLEANPRLTTAYLGYRALAAQNLAARILHPAQVDNPIAWKAETIVFTADGRLRRAIQ